MHALVLTLASAAAAIWAAVLLLPWQPHRTRERLESVLAPVDLGEVAVLIPARNEAHHIARVLLALARQGPGLEVWVVDDESTDGTAEACYAAAAELASSPVIEAHKGRADFCGRQGAAASERADSAARYPVRMTVMAGEALPPGWAGKLWALQQAFAQVGRRYVLLLDADIELAPYMIPALLATARARRAALVSVMATLSCRHFWERLLVPAFIFFFKLLYPFALVESGRWAGAAGGCMLVEATALRSLGGFAALRDALIDDCTLAAKLRRRGCRLSLRMSRSVRSLREYERLADFWAMVSRTAFTQLGYSWLLLAATCVALGVAFFAPLAAIAFAPSLLAVVVGLSAVSLMCAAYGPIVRYYRLPLAWAATLPAAAALFLAMTLASALNYWRGTRAEWKERTYEASMD